MEVFTVFRDMLSKIQKIIWRKEDQGHFWTICVTIFTFLDHIKTKLVS